MLRAPAHRGFHETEDTRLLPWLRPLRITHQAAGETDGETPGKGSAKGNPTSAYASLEPTARSPRQGKGKQLIVPCVLDRAHSPRDPPVLPAVLTQVRGLFLEQEEAAWWEWGSSSDSGRGPCRSQ